MLQVRKHPIATFIALAILLSIGLACIVLPANAADNCEVVWQNTNTMSFSPNTPLDIAYLTTGCSGDANLRMTMNGTKVAGPVNYRVDYHWNGAANGAFQFCPELLVGSEWKKIDTRCFTLTVTGGSGSVVQPTVAPTQVPQTIVVTATLQSQQQQPNVVVVPNGSDQGGGQATPVPAQVIELAQVNVNLRAQPGPGKDVKILLMVPAGATATYLGQTTGLDGTLWYSANYNGTVGWMKAKVVQLSAGTQVILLNQDGTPANAGTVQQSVVATNVLNATPTSETGLVHACPNGLPPRLKVGYQGYSTSDNPQAINIREVSNVPGALIANGKIIGKIPVNGVFNVVGVPVCENNILWWLVEYQGIRGWMAEGIEKYFVDALNIPNSFVATVTPDVVATNVQGTVQAVILGMTGTPTPSVPVLTMTVNPATVGSMALPRSCEGAKPTRLASAKMGQALQGGVVIHKLMGSQETYAVIGAWGTFSLLQADCYNGQYWYKVSYIVPVSKEVVEGWIPEATNTDYLVQPVEVVSG